MLLPEPAEAPPGQPIGMADWSCGWEKSVSTCRNGAVYGLLSLIVEKRVLGRQEIGTLSFPSPAMAR
jgi:hypothetical protein